MVITPDVIRNGFRACGMYPYNPDKVDYMKCLSKRREELAECNDKSFVKKEYRTALKVFEFEMGQERTDFYRLVFEKKAERHPSWKKR